MKPELSFYLKIHCEFARLTHCQTLCRINPQRQKEKETDRQTERKTVKRVRQRKGQTDREEDLKRIETETETVHFQGVRDSEPETVGQRDRDSKIKTARQKQYDNKFQ